MSQCTITVKGKDKDKFDFLSKKFGQRAALQSLLEADETVSVPGFISEVEIGTRINAFAFSILNNLITKSSGASVLNLVNAEVMPLELESAILAAKRDLEVSLEEILSKEDISEQDKYKATRIIVALKSFEDLRPKIMDRLNSYGLKMSEINNDIDDLLNDEESEETSKEHIYNMAHTEKNPVDSIPPSVKLYLATLHDLTTDSMGQDTMKLDDIGMAVPVNFDFIYGKLLKNLADIATYEEMVAKVEELSEFDPVIRKIYSDLENDKLNGSVAILLPDGTEAKTFENALFTAFKTTHNEFITVAHETVENEGVKSLKASVYPTNKRKQYKTILQRWATNASKIVDASIESRVTAWNNTLSKVFYPYRDSSTKGAVERKKLYKARLNDSNNFNVLVEVSNALYYLGIDMTPDEVGLLRKEMNKKSAKFGDFIDKTIAPLAEKLWNKGDNIYTDEKGNLTKLSKTVAAISNDISVETFINGENNQIYPINLPTYFSELFTALKSDTQVRRNYILDPLYTSFKFIGDFINGEEIQSASFDTIYNNDMNEGVPFDKLDPVSAMAARFSLFMNFNHKGDPDSQKGWILPPTPSDRSGTSVVRMPKMQFESFSYSAIIDENSELMKWFTGVLEGEFQRIQRVRYEFNTKDKSDLIENYHYKGNKLGNGGFFNYYPDFNSLLVSDEAGFVEDIDFNSPEVIAMKKVVMEKIIEADVTYLSEIGFLEPIPYNQNGKLDYTSIKPSEITAKLAPKGMIIDFNVLNFIAHSLIATHELSALANGDLAFFKAEEIVPGITTANLENANKRAGMAATPGRKLRVGNGGARSKFKVAFLNDAIVSSDSDYLKMLEGVLGKEMAAKYKKSNSTDGQGLVSLKRYTEILNGQGLLTPSLAQTINELQKPVDKIDWNKVTEPLNPVKGFYHGLDFNSETESMEAHSLKYSLLPIFPAAIVNNPTMQSLYNRMIQSNIDEAVFESGAKYGATKLNSIESNEPLKFIELSNHNWRVPQVVPYKTKTEENFGSQMRKLIMGNIEVTADYNGKTGQQLRDNYQTALSMKIERAYKKLAESISTNGKFDPIKIAGKIKEELARNSFKNVSDFLFKALEVSEGETRMPMSFPSIKGRVESSLNSMVRKAVNKLSLPGFVGVVYSSVGYSKNQIEYSKDLKMARLSEDGKTVLPAEIIASPQYFIQSLLKKRKELVKEYEKSSSEDILGDIQTLDLVVSEMKKGNFDITKIPEDLRKVVTYRIPTQGKNSMMAAVIVGFTPESLGSTVTLPAEIVTQSGMDYDIDKIYLEIPHFEFNSGRFDYVSAIEGLSDQQLDNIIIDTHYTVLTNPAHFKELMTPNNSDTLVDLVKELALEGTGSRYWGSLATQDVFRDQNQAGGVFIGIASIANTAHTVFQELGVRIKGRFDKKDSQKGVKVNGVFVDSLSQVYSMDNKGESTGRYISDDHIEIQTAAVDNASNPLLGKLNINTVTGSTYLFLVEAGLGLKYPTYLVNTPIIKELVKRTRANEATMGPEAAFSNALSDLAKERQIDTLQVESQDFDVTENILKDSIDQSKEGKNTTTHDAQILLAFLTFRKYAQEMHQVQSALKIDNIGPKQSLAANLIQQVELSKVSGTYSDSLESGVVSINPADKVSLIELDRELYSKHSLENYEKYGLHGAIEATSSVIADGSPLVMEVVSKFQDITGSRLNEKDVRMLINDFYTYFFINARSYEFEASTLSIFEGRDVARLLLGKNSVGKRVVKAQKEDLLEAKKDITHTPNRFLQSLTVTLGEKRSGYDTVSFNNTLSKALSGDQKTMISNEFLKMFESENEDLSELAQDLFLYSMFTEGFNSGIDSFSEYIPMELYESIENPETGKSLIEEFKTAVNNFTQPKKFDTDTFILRFLQNRGAQLKGLKDLRKLNIKALKEYLSTHPNVRYFIARSPQKSGFGIAKNLGKGFYNIVASPIGVKNVHVEYQSGNFISELTSSADVLNRALYSEDVIETENSTCVL